MVGGDLRDSLSLCAAVRVFVFTVGGDRWTLLFGYLLDTHPCLSSNSQKPTLAALSLSDRLTQALFQVSVGKIVALRLM